MSQYDACLAGYYGMHNSGDDALLAASIWGAKKYLGATRLTATTPSAIKLNGHERLLPSLVNTQRFRGQNRLLRYFQAFQAQRIIFGGGSVFHTAQDINIKRHMMRIAGSKPSMAIGVGLGPFENSAAEVACAQFLNECAYTGLRDAESFEIAKSLAPNANIALTFDLAPLLLCNPALQFKPLPKSGIAVCLCPVERLRGEDELERKRILLLAQSLAAVYAATGETIYLINLNGHRQLGDSQVHRELKQQLPEHVPVRIIDYDPEPLRVLQRMAAFKVVLSMRLHGSILSFLANTPVVSLNYHSKCNGWCEQVGMPEELRFETDDIDPESLQRVLVKGLENGFSNCDLNSADAIKAAQLNWRQLS